MQRLLEYLFLFSFLLFGFTNAESQIVADTFYVPNYPIPNLYYTNSAPELPLQVVNSKLPYFPSKYYNQYNLPSCGQAASIYYCLTYETNRILNQLADSMHIMSPLYTFGFLNGGNGWYGASAFDSWNIVKSQGNPNIVDYNAPHPIAESRDTYWMNAYDNYYRGMKNRISSYHSLDVETDEDLKILQHYLDDHLNGSEHGGVAIFYSSPQFLHDGQVATFYPDDDLFQYLNVFNNLIGDPTHCLTLSGYYNNNQVDFNGDGLITDSLDINDDGIVDLHDNEKILWVVVNSYGENNGKGTVLLKYDALTQVWNKQVFMPIPDTAYNPVLTFKVKIKHPCRNAIKISAGISADLNADYPEKIIDFPIFNFQGAHNNMSGSDSIPNPEELEFGIDATDLLTKVDANGQVKVFVIIDNASTEIGELQYLSVLHYDNQSNTEYNLINSQTEIPIASNTCYETIVDVSSQINDSVLQINYDDFLVAQTGLGASFNLNIEGGTPPYVYSLTQNNEYSQELRNDLIYTPIYDIYNHPIWNYQNQYSINIDWPIPFAGEYWDSITISQTGVVSFIGIPYKNQERYPYEYLREQVYDNLQITYETGFRNQKHMSCYYQTDSCVKIWFNSLNGASPNAHIDLFRDGRVIITYDEYLFPYNYHYTAGINTVVGKYYSQLPPLYSDYEYNAVVFQPIIQESLFSIDSLANLNMQEVNISGLYNVTVSVCDANGKTASKRIEVEVIEGEILESNFYPNPMHDYAHLTLYTMGSGVAEMEIVNIAGQKVFRKTINIHQGSNIIEISASETGMSNGMYLCSITYLGKTDVFRFVVM